MLLLLFSILLGYCLLNQFIKLKNPIMVFSGSFIIGSIVSGTMLYISELLSIYTLKDRLCGNIIYFLISTAYIVYSFYSRKVFGSLKTDTINFFKNKAVVILFILFMLYSSWLNYGTFYEESGDIRIAYGAYSDIMYHHAFVRSVSIGDNVPTTYPYFANTQIHYHFMFDYYAGKMAQFGFSTLDALNILSLLSMTILLLLIYEFGRKYFNSKAVGILSAVLLIFSSSLAAFEWIYKNQNTNLIQGIIKRTGWISNATFESWGLFNFNVFINQRHFAFSIAICVFFALYLVLRREMKNTTQYKKRDVKRNIFIGIVIGMTPFWNIISAAVCIAFIGLFGISTFFKNKAYTISKVNTALICTLIILPQLLLFKSGDTVLSQYPKLHFGYALDKFSVMGFITYYFKVFGLKLILIFVSVFFVNKVKRIDFFIFLVPFIIANVLQMGVVLYDNNKFMFMWLVFANCFAAYMLVSLYRLPVIVREKIESIRKKKERKIQEELSSSDENLENVMLSIAEETTESEPQQTVNENSEAVLQVAAASSEKSDHRKDKTSRINTERLLIYLSLAKPIAVILTITVILSGLFDIFAVNNMTRYKIKDNSSQLNQWILKNTNRDSIFMTDTFIPADDNPITAVTLSGRMLYAVKNDVDSSCNLEPRLKNITKIYSFSEGLDKTIELIKKEKIDYILVDKNVRNNKDLNLNEAMFEQNFKLEYTGVKEYGEGDVKVYAIRNK